MGLRRNQKRDDVDVYDRLLPFVDRHTRRLMERESVADAALAAAAAADEARAVADPAE